MRFGLLTAATTACILLLVPSATAHSPAFSADNRVRASIGLLGEPVVVDAPTGLDICFTHNLQAGPRPVVDVAAPLDLHAKLIAPNGAVHEDDLKRQFGKDNCVTFLEPLVLTQPGQYLVELTGSINGTTFDARGINAGGAVQPRSAIAFPDQGIQSSVDLQARVAALETKISELEKRPSPAPGPLLMVGLLAAAILLRRHV